MPGTTVSISEDQDGDGFTAPADCDDHDATVFPGAPEVWYDGVDQACDGGSDFDQDGDGVDAVGFGDDCDDLDPEIHPGHVRVCGDDRDNDCDGKGDCELLGEVIAPDIAAATLQGHVELGGAGMQLATGDVDADGEADLLIAGGRVKSAWLMLGPFQGEMSLEDNVGTFGSSYSIALGDLDGDGYDDVVGVADQLAVGPDPFQIWYGPDPQGGAPDAIVTPFDSSPGGGVILADLDADGQLDGLFGATAAKLDAYDPDDLGGRGMVGIEYGPIGGDLGPGDMDAFVIQEGDPWPTQQIALVNADGDLTGDGLVELLFTAPSSNPSMAYIMVPPLPLVSFLSNADFELEETREPIVEMTAAGDNNGDGYRDLFVGHLDTALGESWIELYDGPFSVGESLTISAQLSLEYVRQLESAGDVDGDGLGDLLIGAPLERDADANWEGHVYLAYGPVTGGVDWPDCGAVFFGDVTGRDDFGMSVLAMDGDRSGPGDFLVGAPLGAGSRGLVYLILGSDAGL